MSPCASEHFIELKLWSFNQDDVDLRVGQVVQVAPSAQKDPEDPGDKTQQIVNS